MSSISNNSRVFVSGQTVELNVIDLVLIQVWLGHAMLLSEQLNVIILGNSGGICMIHIVDKDGQGSSLVFQVSDA